MCFCSIAGVVVRERLLWRVRNAVENSFPTAVGRFLLTNQESYLMTGWLYILKVANHRDVHFDVQKVGYAFFWRFLFLMGLMRALLLRTKKVNQF